MINNYMEIKFKALSINEGFARTCVASFCLQLNPTIEELNDIKTAVSEAVTNCVVHAYPNRIGDVNLRCEIEGDDTVVVTISDTGIGISNFAEARMPFFTTKANYERSGMGFAVMESFMDTLELSKNGEHGLVVTMKKRLGRIDSQVVGG